MWAEFQSTFRVLQIFLLPLHTKHQEQFNLHQPSLTATVVKIRCGSFDEPNAMSSLLEYC